MTKNGKIYVLRGRGPIFLGGKSSITTIYNEIWVRKSTEMSIFDRDPRGDPPRGGPAGGVRPPVGVKKIGIFFAHFSWKSWFPDPPHFFEKIVIFCNISGFPWSNRSSGMKIMISISESQIRDTIHDLMGWVIIFLEKWLNDVKNFKFLIWIVWFQWHRELTLWKFKAR